MKIIYCEDEAVQRILIAEMIRTHYASLGVLIETLPCAHKLREVQGELGLLITDGNMKSSTYEDSINYRNGLFPNTPLIVYTGDSILVRKLNQKGVHAVTKSGNLNELLDAIEKETTLKRK